MVRLMKSIRNILVLGATAVLVALARADENEAVKKDLAQLQGEWVMVSGSADGEPMPEETRKLMKRVCKGDEITVMMGERVYIKAKITIDPSKKPKTIDYDMTEGFTKGKKQLGIYELDGGQFKSCFAAVGADRPKEFSSPAGEGRTLSVWKRQKETAPAH